MLILSPVGILLLLLGNGTKISFPAYIKSNFQDKILLQKRTLAATFKKWPLVYKTVLLHYDGQKKNTQIRNALGFR